MNCVCSRHSAQQLGVLVFSGRYHSRGVITLLFDFVEDSDPNIRAVAALSLAKTGAVLLIINT